MSGIRIVSVFLFAVMVTAGINAQSADSAKSSSIKTYRGGFGIYPMTGRTMVGYRSNLQKNWAFETKLGYVFTMAPQLNLEVNAIHRHYRNEILNFYSGVGFTLDGFTPGCVIPIGFEIKPFEKYPNIVLVAEASPKITFSFSSAFYSTLNGNVGVIFYRPAKSK